MGEPSQREAIDQAGWAADRTLASRACRDEGILHRVKMIPVLGSSIVC